MTKQLNRIQDYVRAHVRALAFDVYPCRTFLHIFDIFQTRIVHLLLLWDKIIQLRAVGIKPKTSV